MNGDQTHDVILREPIYREPLGPLTASEIAFIENAAAKRLADVLERPEMYEPFVCEVRADGLEVLVKCLKWRGKMMSVDGHSPFRVEIDGDDEAPS